MKAELSLEELETIRAALPPTQVKAINLVMLKIATASRSAFRRALSFRR